MTRGPDHPGEIHLPEVSQHAGQDGFPHFREAHSLDYCPGRLGRGRHRDRKLAKKALKCGFKRRRCSVIHNQASKGFSLAVMAILKAGEVLLLKRREDGAFHDIIGFAQLRYTMSRLHLPARSEPGFLARAFDRWA